MHRLRPRLRLLHHQGALRLLQVALHLQSELKQRRSRFVTRIAEFNTLRSLSRFELKLGVNPPVLSLSPLRFKLVQHCKIVKERCAFSKLRSICSASSSWGRGQTEVRRFSYSVTELMYRGEGITS